MTASSTRYSNSPSQVKYGVQSMKSLAPGRGAHMTEHEALRSLVIEALWKSFPECANEPEIAECATEYFRDKHGNPISARTIRYWLRGDTLPHAIHMRTLFMMQPAMFMAAWLGVGK